MKNSDSILATSANNRIRKNSTLDISIKIIRVLSSVTTTSTNSKNLIYIICFNCDKKDHYIDNYIELKKNSNILDNKV